MHSLTALMCNFLLKYNIEVLSICIFDKPAIRPVFSYDRHSFEGDLLCRARFCEELLRTTSSSPSAAASPAMVTANGLEHLPRWPWSSVRSTGGPVCPSVTLSFSWLNQTFGCVLIYVTCYIWLTMISSFTTDFCQTTFYLQNLALSLTHLKKIKRTLYEGVFTYIYGFSSPCYSRL